ncbi:TPA: hypothetical protein ACH3X1_004970 [Trebouxia sp. C0004]
MNHQVHSATKKKPCELVFDRHPRPHVYPGLPVDDMILDEDHVRQHIVQLNDDDDDDGDDGQEAGPGDINAWHAAKKHAHTTTSSPLPPRPKPVGDYRAALSSGSPLPQRPKQPFGDYRAALSSGNPLPQRPKQPFGDYRAALSSGNQLPLPYQAAVKSRPALGAPGTQLYAARQASRAALSQGKIADLRLAAPYLYWGRILIHK